MNNQSCILEKKTPHYKEIIIRFYKFEKFVIFHLKNFWVQFGNQSIHSTLSNVGDCISMKFKPQNKTWELYM
jgi:hypothetical protein